ncbi:uncharacterized protein LOC104868956 isoform X2 [Fukomys damarensis]|uniref:uncharacterized protein LOC104868956 isoform X2 n=1 Tax=Fukomys damarensis TaxID=885580 RepID=UPI0014554B44|nr:uncharacterized protein LOC104868956 isoform X2 [Fukomys damarensis]
MNYGDRNLSQFPRSTELEADLKDSPFTLPQAFPPNSLLKEDFLGMTWLDVNPPSLAVVPSNSTKPWLAQYLSCTDPRPCQEGSELRRDAVCEKPDCSVPELFCAWDSKIKDLISTLKNFTISEETGKECSFCSDKTWLQVPALPPSSTRSLSKSVATLSLHLLINKVEDNENQGEGMARRKCSEAMRGFVREQ